MNGNWLIVLGGMMCLFGCATEEAHTKKNSSKESAFSLESKGTVSSNNKKTENGYSYEEAEYSVSEGKETEDRKPILKEELRPVSSRGSETFQLAMVQKGDVKVLVNLSNSRALKQKVLMDQTPAPSEEMKERLEKFEDESRSLKTEGSYVYTGPFRTSRKTFGVYLTGDRESEQLKQNLQKIFFSRWVKISESQAKSELESENVMVCEMNGVYYKISRPTAGLARNSAERSQELNTYANAKQQFMITLDKSLSLPSVSSNYGERPFK